jgi:hypothetical protein
MEIKRIIFSLLFILIYFTGYSNNELTKLTASIGSQVEQNKLNDSLGKSDLNKYAFSFRYDFKSKSFVECPVEYALWAGKPYTNPGDNGIWDDPYGEFNWWAPMHQELCDFNTSNSNGIKQYAILVFFPRPVESIITDEVEGSLLPIIPFYNTVWDDGSNLTDYKNFMANFSNVLKSDLEASIFNEADEKILTVTSVNLQVLEGYDYYIGEHKTDTYFFESSLLEENVLNAAINYGKFITADLSEVDPLLVEFPKRIYSIIDYFQILPSTSSLCDIPYDVSPCGSQSGIKDYLIFACSLYPNPNPEENELIAGIKEHLIETDCDLTFSFPTSSDDPLNIWALDLLNGFKSSDFTKWDQFVLSKLMAVDIESADYNTYKLWFKYSNRADHEALKANERGRIIRIFHFFAKDNPELFPLGAYITDLNNLFEQALEKNKKYQSDLISEIDDKEFLDWLVWTVCDNPFSLEIWELKIMKSLTELGNNAALYANVDFENFVGENPKKTFIWKIPPYYTSLDQHFNYENARLDESGLVKFDGTKVVNVTCEYVTPYDFALHEWFDISWFCDIEEEEVVYDDLTPFQTVAVIPGEEFITRTDCSTLLSEGTCAFKTKMMPAICFAWFIEKQEDDNNVNYGIDALVVASIAISGTQVGSYIVAESLSNAALSGLIGAADVTFLSTSYIQPTILDEMYGDDLSNEEKNKIIADLQLTSGSFAAGLGIVDIVRAMKGFSTYRRVSLATNISDVDHQKMLFAIEKAIQKETEALKKWATKLGISPDVKTAIFSLGLNNAEIFHLIGWFANSPNATSKASAIKFLAVSLNDAELTRELMRLSEIKLGKFLDDFNDFNRFVSDEKLINAWNKLYSRNVPYELRIDLEVQKTLSSYNKSLISDKVKNWSDEEFLEHFNFIKSNPNSAVKIRNYIDNGVIFLGDNEVELSHFLKVILDKPSGTPYSGDIYRSLSISVVDDPIINAVPHEISDWSVQYAWGRYDLPSAIVDGGEGALYCGTSLPGNHTEMTHYNDWLYFYTYEYTNVNISNLLDLTDPAVRQQVGVDFSLLTRVQETGITVSDKQFNYKFTNALGTWIRNNYNGVIVPGARGAQDYSNVVLFDQSVVNVALGTTVPTPIPK